MIKIDFVILIPIILAIYSGFGIFAKTKYEKFNKMLIPTFIILILFIIISFTWDISATTYNTSLIKEIDCEIPDKIKTNHSFGLFYMVFIPCLTFIYLSILDWFFKPN